MAFKLFGFEINRVKDDPKEQTGKSFVPPDDMDPAHTVEFGIAGAYGQFVDMEGTVRNEADLINKYRQMVFDPEMDFSLEEITNEAIVINNEEPIVTIALDDCKGISESLKSKIRDEFEYICKLINFNFYASEIFRRWYIDGRLVYHIVINNEHPENGIQELRPIDPIRIRKIREIRKQADPKTGMDTIAKIVEYYIYDHLKSLGINVTSSATSGMRIAKDSITFVPSGIYDQTRRMTLSYLQKSIKPLNQLRMMEDAALIYFLARAPERRAFYIDVGNLPKLKAEQYLRDIMLKYKNKITYDASTGAVMDSKKHMCLSMDTKIPLLDGRVLTISDIAKELSIGRNLWAYSCDPITGAFSPGLITWAGETRKDAQVIKLTLDNGKSIVCTPDHKFPVWDKGFVEAKDLNVGESMIPRYIRSKSIISGQPEYQQIFNNETKKWQFTHRCVSLWKDKTNIENDYNFDTGLSNRLKNTIHHKNINRFDNSPENLVRMNNLDHLKWHKFNSSLAGKVGGKKSSYLGKSQENLSIGRKKLKELLKDQDWNIEFREKQRAGWTKDKRNAASNYAKNRNLSVMGNSKKKILFEDDTHLEMFRKKYRTEYTEDMFALLYQFTKIGLTAKQMIEKFNTEMDFTEWQNLNSEKVGTQKDWSKINKGDIHRMIDAIGFESLSEYRDSITFRNHRILNIQYLDERIDTGCIEIDGDEIYHNYHTFALDAGIYTKNSLIEDFWLPRREGGRGTEIETLAGAGNLQETTEVIDYFKKRLYRSLNIPVARLESDTSFNLGKASEISRDEVKFSKFINKLRRRFSVLFDDPLGKQLVLKKIMTWEEWVDIKQDIIYRFASDSHFAELKESELLNDRLNIVNDAENYVGKYFSRAYIRKKVLKQSEEEIEEIDKEIEEEIKQGKIEDPNGGGDENGPPVGDDDEDENGQQQAPPENAGGGEEPQSTKQKPQEQLVEAKPSGRNSIKSKKYVPIAVENISENSFDEIYDETFAE